ncbi:MAG: type II toxin-antitoxin system HicB family antitoxin [Acidobacteriia bacterium]|nr:type II toxin-antitoxin system HicB family antitoxin [Terriglobia bacterium]
MTYKGYEAVVEFDEEAGVLSGEVINTRDVITFQGESVEALKKAFEDSVDDYLAFCRKRNEEPERPFSGTFTLRVPPQLHRQITLEARRHGKSLNSYVIDRLKSRAVSPR